MAARHYPPEADRFWSRVNKTEGCWLWTGSCSKRGYGQFAVNKYTTVRAHRWAWEKANGPIPDQMFVLHRCDVRTCVNPDHLFLGTHADNMADMANKGRAATGLNNGAYTRPERRPSGKRNGRVTKPESTPRGDAHGMAKLTEQDIRSIRRERANGQTLAALGRAHGVTKQAIWLVVNRKKWAHVTDGPPALTP